MTNIGIVIGWKFDHQPGMATKGGVITKFPGGIPSEADQDLWTSEYESQIPLFEWQEAMSESDVTMIPRWLEDHIREDHGGVSGNASLQQKYDDKKALRLKRPE